jgi:hypothetical protein
MFWLRKSIKAGRLKDCWNLGIDKIEPQSQDDGKSVDCGESYFVPSCKHQSFESPFAAMSDEVHENILRHSLNTDPVSCPKNCTFYENRRWGQIRHAATTGLSAIYKTTSGTLKGFATLPWATQVALIILILLAISPKWAPLLLSIVKALK